jgi:hypothetical protein
MSDKKLKCSDCNIELEENGNCPNCKAASSFAAPPLLDADVDICGLCGEPGADKYAHPIHWPGEKIPDSPLVHAECESAECGRAHAALNDRQRREFLRSI